LLGWRMDPILMVGSKSGHGTMTWARRVSMVEERSRRGQPTTTIRTLLTPMGEALGMARSSCIASQRRMHRSERRFLRGIDTGTRRVKKWDLGTIRECPVTPTGPSPQTTQSARVLRGPISTCRSSLTCPSRQRRSRTQLVTQLVLAARGVRRCRRHRSLQVQPLRLQRTPIRGLGSPSPAGATALPPMRRVPRIPPAERYREM
jgi:hypothetical protein